MSLPLLTYAPTYTLYALAPTFSGFAILESSCVVSCPHYRALKLNNGNYK